MPSLHLVARIVRAATLCLLCATRIHAQQRALSLADVYDAVTRVNPRIRSAHALTRASESRVPSTTRPPDPELQFGLMNYGVPRFGADAYTGMRQWQLMQTIPAPGKLSSATAVARSEVEVLRARASDTQLIVYQDAALALVDLWELDERLKAGRARATVLTEATSATTSGYRERTAPQTAALQAQLALSAAASDTLRLAVARNVAAVRLGTLIALDAEQVQVTAPELPDSIPSLADLMRIAIERRPAIIAQEAMVKSAAADRQRMSREQWPDLRVGLQYGERPMGGSTDRMASVMVGASLPIFARLRQTQLLEASRAQLDAVTAETEAVRWETRSRVSEAHAQLVGARRLASLYTQTILPQAEAALASATSAYRASAADFSVVMERAIELSRLREELIRTRADEFRSWITLESLTTRPLLRQHSASGAHS